LETRLSECGKSPAGSDRSAISFQSSSSVNCAGSVDRRNGERHAGCAAKAPASARDSTAVASRPRRHRPPAGRLTRAAGRVSDTRRGDDITGRGDLRDDRAEPIQVGDIGGVRGRLDAQCGQIGQVIYGSCKAGVNGLVLPMARDLMDLGIRVNSVMPGIFATPLMLGMKDRNPQMWDQLNASVPFPKRLGEPEEFASLILEIARNSYLNGHQFRLDGAIRMPPK